MIPASSDASPDGPSSSGSQPPEPPQPAPAATSSSEPAPPDGGGSREMKEYEQLLARTRELMETIAFCMSGYYCTLKAYFCRGARPSREFLQIKCVEKLRYERGDLHKRPVDWQEAFAYWSLEGHSAAFDKHFQEDVELETLYRRVKDEPPPKATPPNARMPRGLSAQLANGFPLHLVKPPEEEHRVWRWQHARLVEDVAGCSRGHYCTLKEILFSAPHIARDLMQFKCMEKFKFERGDYFKRPVGWEEAARMWIAEGYAERFAASYSIDLHYEELYRRVMGR